MYISKYVTTILINFVSVTISFTLNITIDFPDLLGPPQPCSIKNKKDSENIKLIIVTKITIIVLITK